MTPSPGPAAGAIVAEAPVNRGQGAALRLGYRIALERGARYIVTTDADGQYSPLDVAAVLAPVVADRADFVTGSRRLGGELTADPLRSVGVRTWWRERRGAAEIGTMAEGSATVAAGR